MRRSSMRGLRVVLLASFALVSTAHAETERGEYRPSRGDVLQAARAPRLSSIGVDAIRFSSTPALGGRGWIVELRKGQAGGAVGEAQFFSGHPRTKWTRTGWIKLSLPDAAYAELASRIDLLLTRKEPASASDEVVVCTDGPGYLTERRRAGMTVWLSGFCDGNPNDEIAVLMSDAISRFGPMPDSGAE